jgi:uncharacterized protein (DUF983 family)
MNLEKFREVTEGEGVASLFLEVGKRVKSFFVWVWSADFEDMVLGSLLMLLVTGCGLLALFGLIMLFWATFNTSWLWVFSWPPAIILVTIGEIKAVKGLISLYDDFFK